MARFKDSVSLQLFDVQRLCSLAGYKSYLDDLDDVVFYDLVNAIYELHETFELNSFKDCCKDEC